MSSTAVLAFAGAATTACNPVANYRGVCGEEGRVLLPRELVRAALPSIYLEPVGAQVGRAEVERVNNAFRAAVRRGNAPGSCCSFSKTGALSDSRDVALSPGERLVTYGIHGFVTARWTADVQTTGGPRRVLFEDSFAVNKCGTTAGVGG